MASGIPQSIPWAGKRAQARALNLSTLFVVALLLGGFVSLLYLTQASGVATTGYDLKRLEDEKSQWEIKNAQLSLKAAELQSLDRIQREARARLQMGPPAKLLFVPVEAPAKPIVGGSAGERPSAAATGTASRASPTIASWLADLRDLLGL